MIYDCFVLGEKRNAIFYQGGAGGLKQLTVGTAATSSDKSTVLVIPGQHDASGVKWYYCTGATASALETVTYGTAITAAKWTELAAASAEITPASGSTVIRVIEVDKDSKPIAVGDAVLHVG